MAGYSGTPLPKKLGIKPGHKVVIINQPERWELEPAELLEDVRISTRRGKADIYLIFSKRSGHLRTEFHKAMTHIPPDGAIWISWPKKSSGVETDITEDTLRTLFLPTGMVDNKVCAVDETWSGLRFVVRRENRAGWGDSTQ